MANIIIGTAGHVDHGKTSLVKAMTGKDTDRLQEEKDRGISIELGFAPLKLPSGNLAGIVDVPGHERFIKNMLAGVGGIDLVLFIIAADEGVMPQTQEHLDIINLLQIPQGIVVITKTDLVEPDWLELVKEEIKPVLKGTVLEKAPVIEVSSITGRGIPELINLLEEKVETIKPKEGIGKIRLPIDRVFTITGFGTVVTGTLISGTIHLGDELEIYPQGIKTRVRSLQVHGKKAEEVVAGHRIAVNVTDLEVSEIDRGNLLATTNSLTPSFRFDLWFTLLSSAPKNLKNRTRIRVYLGSAEVFGRAILLDREELSPGESCFVQIILEEPLAGMKNDRLVVRTYSPMTTIGGGTIIDPNPPKHRRFKKDVLEGLTLKLEGSPEEIIHNYLIGHKGLVSQEDIYKDLSLDQGTGREALNALIAEGKIKSITFSNKELYLAIERYEHWKKIIVDILDKFHQENPLKRGMAKEEIRTKKFPDLNNKVFNNVLEAYQNDGEIKIYEQYIALKDFKVTMDKLTEAAKNKIEADYLKEIFTPPSWNEVVEGAKLQPRISETLLQYLLDEEILIKIDNLFFHRKAIQEAKKVIVEELQLHETIDIGKVRDLLNTSRKFALPIMEYFDQQKITRRVGDQRVLFNSSIKR